MKRRFHDIVALQQLKAVYYRNYEFENDCSEKCIIIRRRTSAVYSSAQNPSYSRMILLFCSQLY